MMIRPTLGLAIKGEADGAIIESMCSDVLAETGTSMCIAVRSAFAKGESKKRIYVLVTHAAPMRDWDIME